MRKIVTTFALGLLALLAWQCEQPVKGTVIKGQINNGSNLQVFLDDVGVGGASNVIGKTEMGPEGEFELKFPEGVEPGPYQLRIGTQRVGLFLDGTEKVLDISGDLSKLQTYNFEVEGSATSESMVEMLQQLVRKEASINDVKAYVDTVSDAGLGAFMAMQALGTSGQYIDVQKKAVARLKQERPDSRMIEGFDQLIGAIEQNKASMEASQLVKVGQPAPDITLPAPDGSTYSLSDLRGKVVLLDFWASWCGPCRRENPNVVRVYEDYKNQGFTVFSVSLDGMDSKTRKRMTSETQIEAYMQNQKQRWVGAIEQDNLKWEYHVSDLKKWESVAAQKYGVKSIPKAFIIDRDGNIAAVGVRGAEQIEAEIKKLL